MLHDEIGSFTGQCILLFNLEFCLLNFELKNSPVVLFDGVCNLCEGSVRFIIERDPKGIFRFASLQSDAGKSLAEAHGADASHLNTMMLIENGRLYKRSTAALRIARRLRFPWSLGWIFIIVPPFIRDAIYNVISRNRYKWFGEKETCMIPTPELRERFL